MMQSEGIRSLAQREHNEDASAKRVVLRVQDPDTGDWANVGASDNGDGTFSIRSGDPNLAVRLDDVSTADVTYIGKASIASTTSDAVWQIAKLDTSSGLVKTWADGSASFTQVWDDRTTITYS
jgi:hypothetical protein